MKRFFFLLLPLLVQCSSSSGTGGGGGGGGGTDYTTGYVKASGTGFNEHNFTAQCRCVYDVVTNGIVASCVGSTYASDQASGIVQIMSGYHGVGTYTSGANVMLVVRKNNGLMMSTLGIGTGSLTITEGGTAVGQRITGNFSGDNISGTTSNGVEVISLSGSFSCVIK